MGKLEDPAPAFSRGALAARGLTAPSGLNVDGGWCLDRALVVGGEAGGLAAHQALFEQRRQEGREDHRPKRRDPEFTNVAQDL